VTVKAPSPSPNFQVHAGGVGSRIGL